MNPARERRSIARRAALLAMIGAELDRQLESLRARSSSMRGRAAALLASAGVTGGLIGSQAPTILGSASVSLLVFAALCGLAVLAPALGDGVPIEEFEEKAWNDSPAEAQRRLNRWKTDDLLAGESQLRNQRYLVLMGFCGLAVSLVLVALDLTTGQEMP